MKCNCKYDFFAYHEGNYSPEMLREIDKHISVCDECRNLSVQVKLLNVAIKEQKQVKPDFYMPQRIVAKINSRQSFDSFLRPFPVFTMVILLALFVGIGIGVFATKTSQQNTDNLGWNDQNQEVIEMALLNEN